MISGGGSWARGRCRAAPSKHKYLVWQINLRKVVNDKDFFLKYVFKKKL